MNEGPGTLLKNAARYRMILAVLMIIFGCLAIFMPMLTGIAVAMVFGWIILIAGVVNLVHAFTGGVGNFLWRIVIAVIYLLGGAYLVFNPGMALGALTLAIAVIFIVEGVTQIIGFFGARGMPGAGWLLFSGIAAIALGVLIWQNWPSDSAWMIGTLIGVNLLVCGLTRLMAASALKRVASIAG